MSDQPQPLRPEFYVAPGGVPEPRKPPIRETGLLRWLRENLFRSTADTIITIITVLIVGVVLVNVLNWALFTAQWEIVFSNLRVLSVGIQFPPEEVWRAQVVGMIAIFLSLLSVGVWGRLPRWFNITIVIIAILMIVVPPLAQVVPKPPVYTYVAADFDPRQVNFIAQQGQTVTLTLDPLTTVDEFRLETVQGYVENDNQQANTSFDAYSAASTEVVLTDQRDPEAYDLNASIQVWDADGNVIAESLFSESTTEPLTLTWEAPAAGWYTYTVIMDEAAPGEDGSAWLVTENVEVFQSTRAARAARTDTYGLPPELDCRGCAAFVNRTDLRYQGERTVAQWFSLQLAPFVLELRPLFFIALIIGAAGYLLGIASKRGFLRVLRVPQQVERVIAGIGGALLVLYFAAQIFGLTGANPNTSTLYLIILAALSIAVIAYALTQLARSEGGARSRGVALLWAISFPIILTFVNGVAGVQDLTPIPSDELGGLLLTLLLSVIAIIASFPIGLLLALGRQSTLPVVSGLCTVFIEVVRGVPLITLLFMGRLILPFFGFGLGDVDLLIRISVVLTLFTAAYMAEVIRGGLQTIPKGQYEAAHAVGLNDFWTNILIVIPQALRMVIPAIMGQAVSLFKDTSLVYIIGLFELVGTMNQLLGDSQTGYLMFPREGYLFVGIVFFIFSYLMAEASRRLEKTGSGAVRRETI